MRHFLILVLLLCCVSGSDASRRRALLFQQEVGSAGSPAWQFITTGTNSATAFYTADTEAVSHDIVVTGSGNITQLLLLVRNDGGSVRNLKLALYSQDGATLYGSGTTTIATTDDNVFRIITLDTPRANSGTTTYQISCAADSSDIAFYALTGDTPAGAEDICTGLTYAGFPPTPICTPTFNDLDRKLCAGAYLVP